MGETCKTALIRREICIGWNDNRCWQSEREEQQVCVTPQKSRQAAGALQKALQEKCKLSRKGIGPYSLLHKEAWLCEWKKK